MSYERVDLQHFAATFGTETEISSGALGGSIVAVSDEFFAEAFHLIKVEPAPSLKGQFGPKGALFSGWETRRHNPDHDWCIIKLGAAGLVSGFDIDTSHFNGNEAPEASVEALFSEAAPSQTDSRWTEILPKVNLGPNSRHLFKISRMSVAYNYLKLKMYPDGGIARFRAYGLVKAMFPDNVDENVDLAHVFAGGRVVFTSDQHFGVGSNLLLPGRGKDMGDGWETKRSRVKGHKDWVIIKLGEGGLLELTEIDTAHYMGNYPESCEMHALASDEVIPVAEESSWTPILPRTKLGPHRRHFFHLQNVEDKIYTHVRLTIYPDGGVKRVRVIGKRDPTSTKGIIVSCPEVTGAGAASHVETFEMNRGGGVDASTQTALTSKPSPPIPRRKLISAIALTPEAFAPFGHVIQAYPNPHSAPRGVRITAANQGTATKFHKLAPVESSYPVETREAAGTGFSVYRCKPLPEEEAYKEGGWEVRLLERHRYTNQAFVPMGGGRGPFDEGDEDGEAPVGGRAYLVVVAGNGKDGMPDLDTLRAFVVSTGQGIVYNTGVWHHPMVALETTMDFTCVETQIGDGSSADCEIVQLDETKGLPRVKIPKF